MKNFVPLKQSHHLHNKGFLMDLTSRQHASYTSVTNCTPFFLSPLTSLTTFLLCCLLALCATPARAAEDEAEKARKILAQFLAPNADYAALTQKLRPGRQDYAAYFGSDGGKRAMDFYDQYWQASQIVIRPRSGQTELVLMALDLSELKVGKPLPTGFPENYDKLRSKLRGAKTIYAFKFVKPGESKGMGWDGLVRLGNRWVLFPTPWKALGD